MELHVLLGHVQQADCSYSCNQTNGIADCKTHVHCRILTTSLSPRCLTLTLYIFSNKHSVS